jgi:hypothetical protein
MNSMLLFMNLKTAQPTITEEITTFSIDGIEFNKTENDRNPADCSVFQGVKEKRNYIVIYENGKLEFCTSFSR